MQDWFNLIGAGCQLPARALQDLRDVGFFVIPGPIAPDRLVHLAAAYDAAIAAANPEDVKIGSTSTRVRDFVNRGSEFDELYIHQPVLEACHRIIGQPFRLSTMHARTVRPRSLAQELHVDFERDREGWTMIGFIFMVDEFRRDNGATRFIPGSHNWSTVPDESKLDVGQMTKIKSWRAVRQARSSSSMGPSGTDIRQIRPTSRAVQFKGHISGAKHRPVKTCLNACVLTLSLA